MPPSDIKTELAPLVCEPWCHFSKPDKIDPDEKCGGLIVVAELFRQEPETEGPLEELRADDEPGSKVVGRVAELMCRACPFRAEDCDFADPKGPQNAPPCGGLLLLAAAIEEEAVDLESVIDACQALKYLAADDEAVLKMIETPHVYHVGTDELYEINGEVAAFWPECDGTRRVHDLGPDPEFLDFCLDEGLLALSDQPRPVKVRSGGQSPRPSLRYLELQITRQCNLACRHCYLGPAEAVDLPLDSVVRVLTEFEDMSGLRVMISGGEPLIHPDFWAINDRLADFALRRVLLTNGLMLTPETCRPLNFHEVQVSLDGLKDGHEALRGKGSFEKTLAGIRAALEAGLQVAVATMVHGANLGEFKGLGKMLDKLGVSEWGIDSPVISGRLAEASDLWVTPAQAAERMVLGFGGGLHGGGDGFACGRHLGAITPEGLFAPCGFYEPLGKMDEGLLECWSRRKWLSLSELDCGPCEHATACGGGCRFRADSPTGKDPVMCALHDVEGD